MFGFGRRAALESRGQERAAGCPGNCFRGFVSTPDTVGAKVTAETKIQSLRNG